MSAEVCWCCGRLVIPRDPDPWEGRMDGYCYECASNRCDCYPNECPVRQPAAAPPEGLPEDLAAVLRDQSIITPQDAKVWELLAEWADVPSDTASAMTVKEWQQAWSVTCRRMLDVEAENERLREAVRAENESLWAVVEAARALSRSPAPYATQVSWERLDAALAAVSEERG